MKFKSEGKLGECQRVWATVWENVKEFAWNEH